MSLLEGPKQVMSLVIVGLRWRQCSKAPVVRLYTLMIDAAYLYHRDSDSQSASPYSYVPFQIQQTISHEDIAFHENAMGPMYQISTVFNLTLRQPLLYHQLYMISSCILEHRSNYSFDIIMSMGMPASSIYMSHIICISRDRIQ